MILIFVNILQAFAESYIFAQNFIDLYDPYRIIQWMKKQNKFITL
jgi:hypothetical protein